MMLYFLDYFNRLNTLRFQRFIAEIGLHIGDLINCFNAFSDLAEGGILAIKVRGIFMHDEEL